MNCYSLLLICAVLSKENYLFLMHFTPRSFCFNRLFQKLKVHFLRKAINLHAI
jgi:hypothetical protein